MTNLNQHLEWTPKQERKVNRITRYQTEKLTYEQLFIAATLTKFAIKDLVARTNQLKEAGQITQQQYDFFINDLNSYESDDFHKQAGSWGKSQPTVKW
ncbi:MAG: hypothetical protein GY928_08465 [Colwellia sp.]|nr:hypothetical protein [Colwellia sp.]